MTFHDVLQWCASATVEEMRGLLAKCPDDLFVGTVGPKDLLFVPPASISCHRVFGDCDILGVRAGFLSGADARVLPQILKDFQSGKIRADGLEAVCQLMSASPDLFEGKTSAPLQPGQAPAVEDKENSAVPPAAAVLGDGGQGSAAADSENALPAAATVSASAAPEAEAQRTAEEQAADQALGAAQEGA